MKKYVDLEMMKEEAREDIGPKIIDEMAEMPMDITIMTREYKKVVPLVCARWEYDRDNNRHDQLEIVKCSNCGAEAFAAALFVRYGNY